MIITLRALAAEAETKWHADPDRLSKAIQIVEQKTSIYNQHCAPGEWDVRSQHNGWYHVDTKAHSCTCTDSQTGHVCKHRLAVWLHVQANIRSYAEVSRKPESQIMRELGYA